MDGGFLAVAMELHADFNDTCRVYYKTNWIKPCFMYVYTYSLYDVYIYIVRPWNVYSRASTRLIAVGKIWDKEEKIAMANVVG